jgi:hypothetical protein
LKAQPMTCTSFRLSASAAVDDGAQIAAGEALDILHHLLQRAQAGTDQDDTTVASSKAATTQARSSMLRMATLSSRYSSSQLPVATVHPRPATWRPRRSFPRRAGRIGKGVAEDAVLLRQHLAQHRLGCSATSSSPICLSWNFGCMTNSPIPFHRSGE